MSSGFVPPKIDGEFKRAIDDARKVTKEFIKSMSKLERILASQREDARHRFGGGVDSSGEVMWAKDSEAQAMMRWHQTLAELVPDQVVRLLKRWQKRAPFPRKDGKQK